MNQNARLVVIAGGIVALIVLVILLFSLNPPPAPTTPQQEESNSQVSATDYPIMAHIPFYSDDHWSIDGPPLVGEFESPPAGYLMPFYVYIDTTLNDSELRRPADKQHERLEAMRAAAIKYLTDKGVKIEDYAFRYYDPYLQEKYGTTEPKK